MNKPRIYITNEDVKLENSGIVMMVIISYNGKVIIDSTLPHDYYLQKHPYKNQIAIKLCNQCHPIPLEQLFTYKGSLILKEVLIIQRLGDSFAPRVECKIINRIKNGSIKSIDDHAIGKMETQFQFLTFNIPPKYTKTRVTPKVLENQKTLGRVYKVDGKPYSGDFHIMLEGKFMNRKMTGAFHTKESKILRRILKKPPKAARLLPNVARSMQEKGGRFRRTNKR